MVLFRGNHFTFMYAIAYGSQKSNITGIDAVSALLCGGLLF